MCSWERHCGHGYSGPWQAFSRRVRLRRMVFLRPSSSSTDRANFNTETLMFLGYCHGCCIVASCCVVLFVGRVFVFPLAGRILKDAFGCFHNFVPHGLPLFLCNRGNRPRGQRSQIEGVTFRRTPSCQEQIRTDDGRRLYILQNRPPTAYRYSNHRRGSILHF